jgi:fatty acid-binding protein DegV
VSSVVLVTDSSACLPPALFYQSNVRVLPIRILLAHGDLKDTPDAIDLVYRALLSEDTVTSGPPTLVDYLQGIEEQNFDEAIILTPAREFSGMHRLADVAAKLSDRPTEVVDTRSAGAAHCLVALATLRAVNDGAGAREAAAVAREVAARTELVAALPDPESVPRDVGFPLSELANMRGTTHPRFRIRDGAVIPLLDENGSSDALAGLKNVWSELGGPEAEENLIFHGAAEPRAEELRELLGCAAPIVPFSPALALQTGVGCVGVAWTRRS